MSPGLLLDEPGFGRLLKDVKICCGFLAMVQQQLPSLETLSNMRMSYIMELNSYHWKLLCWIHCSFAVLFANLQRGSGAAPFRHIKHKSHIMELNRM